MQCPVEYELLISAIEFFPDATLVIDINGKVVAWNRAMEDMTGVKKSDIVGRGDYAYVVPFYGERRPMLIDFLFCPDVEIEKMYDLVERKGNTIYVEVFVPNIYGGKGAYCWATTSILFDKEGNVIGAIESLRDITDKKKTEEALKLSEEKYRTIFENAIEGIFQSTPDGRYLTVNPALAEMTGYDNPQEMIDTIPDIAHQVYVNPDDRSTFERILDREGYIKGFETQLYRKDRTKIWVSLSGFVVRDREKRILYYEGNVIDITARKLAEKKLWKETRFNRTMIQHSPAFYIAIAPDGRVLFMNQSLLNALEYTIEEVIGKDYLSTFIPWEERESISDIFERIIVKQEQTVNENYTIGKNGKSRLIEWHGMPIVNENDELEYFFGVGIDITERKRAEKSLLDERQKFFLLAENAPFGLALIDDKGYYSYVNTKFREMFGYGLHDIADGRSWCRKAYPEAEYRHTVVGIWLNDVDKFKQDPSVREGRQWTFTVTCKDNTQKEINFIPVRLSSGQYLMTYEDITELKKLQTQLLHSQKMEAIGTLTGGIAHDFNNILTAVMGYTTLAKIKLSDNDPVQPYMDQVLSAAEMATDLTQSLLTFSRKQIIKPKPINLNETIRKAEKLLTRLIGEDIELKFSPSGENPMVIADQTQLEQVLINLAANARDVMPGGGLLSIRTRTVDINEKFTAGHGYGNPGKFALITVSDTGKGIDENIKAKIFEPFFTTKEIGKGTGLGLSIVYGIVKKHNGYIEVESKPGQGTIFMIYLPLAESTFVTKTFKAKERITGGKETVFLAEDDCAVRMLIKNFLEQYGYTVIEAINGDDAVAKFKEHKKNVHLVVLDVVMPKKNGKEVYEEIKEIAAHVPVLFMSGYTYDIIEQKGITSGKMDFVQKPIMHDAFLGKIREMLDQQISRN